MERYNRIASALRIRLLAGDPFIGCILSKLCFIRYVDWVATASTDGKDIFVNPAYFATLTDKEIVFILLHEMYHVVFEHRYRFKAGGFIKEKWNMACDYVINFLLYQRSSEFAGMAVDFSVPSGAALLQDEFGRILDISDMSAEDVYELIEDESAGHPNLGPANDVTCDMPEAGNLQSIHRAVAAAFRETAGLGYAPSGGIVESYVNTLFVRTQTNWKHVLRKMLISERGEEYSYDTPNRKYIPYGLILPGPYSVEDRLNTVFLFMDVSGSMHEGEIIQAANAVYGLLCEFDVTMSIVFWNSSICGIYKSITKHSLKRIKFPSGGGTDIGCVYRFIAERGLGASAYVIFTDGFFASPDLSQFFKQESKIIKKTIIALTKDPMPGVERLGTLARI